jgi:hypothetical protein
MKITTARGLVCCVGDADKLRLTLSHNCVFFSELLVVTAFGDTATQKLCRQPEYAKLVRCYTTDAFTRDGVAFNRGAAIEEGLTVFERRDWMWILDPSICIALHAFNGLDVEFGNVYTGGPKCLPGRLPLPNHLFNAGDPVLRRRPWYGVKKAHADTDGGEAVFLSRWPRNRQKSFDEAITHSSDFLTKLYHESLNRRPVV